jgi:Putative peptidoglycan binding domain/D-alanyl-D-alanine carboxypeptidase
MANRKRTLAKALKPGSTGPFVKKWQQFLRGQGHLLEVDGRFGPATTAASKAFQAKHGLTVDGIVGNQTLGQAALLGFEIVAADEFGFYWGGHFTRRDGMHFEVAKLVKG